VTDSNGAKTHTMRALVELRRRILNGEVPGGTRLLEVAQAEDLQISRTPVREAMSRLAEEGLLERGRSGGFVVRRFATADVIDTIELRGVLEGTAARLAAERGVPEVKMDELLGILADLDSCFGDAEDAVDFDRYTELNTQFHAALARLAGSATIEQELSRVTRLPFAAPSAFLPTGLQPAAFRRYLEIAQGQHRAIVHAVTAREGTRAEAMAREHARSARDNLERFFAGNSDLATPVPALALVDSD
jgi:GntR family transcriptional regulator of vanillate catabolism